MMTKIAVLAALLLPACLAADASDDPELSQVEQHTTPTVNDYCYTSGSSTWCQDYWTSKWCTNGTYTYGWDYDGCYWSGWKDNVYCTNGWQWDARQTHLHC